MQVVKRLVTKKVPGVWNWPFGKKLPPFQKTQHIQKNIGQNTAWISTKRKFWRNLDIGCHRRHQKIILEASWTGQWDQRTMFNTTVWCYPLQQIGKIETFSNAVEKIYALLAKRRPIISTQRNLIKPLLHEQSGALSGKRESNKANSRLKRCASTGKIYFHKIVLKITKR